MKDIIGIECNSCATQWRIEIEIGKNEIETFATLCECGAIIVGNRRNKVDDEIAESMSIKERYLTNGSYSIISIDHEIVNKLPLLELE